MDSANDVALFPIGARVKIKLSGYPTVRVAEDRGRLGPNGSRIYRILVRRRPRPVYVEVREDQLELVEDAKSSNGTANGSGGQPS